MKASWLNGLEEGQKLEMEREFLASALLRSRLKELIEGKLEASRVAQRNKVNYENSAWPYQQADQIGYERALSEIISLIFES